MGSGRWLLHPRSAWCLRAAAPLSWAPAAECHRMSPAPGRSSFYQRHVRLERELSSGGRDLNFSNKHLWTLQLKLILT